MIYDAWQVWPFPRTRSHALKHMLLTDYNSFSSCCCFKNMCRVSSHLSAVPPLSSSPSLSFILASVSLSLTHTPSPKLSVWREIFLCLSRRPNQFGLSQPASCKAEIRYLAFCRVSTLWSLSQPFRVRRGTDHPGKIDCGTRLRWSSNSKSSEAEAMGKQCLVGGIGRSLGTAFL